MKSSEKKQKGQFCKSKKKSEYQLEKAEESHEGNHNKHELNIGITSTESARPTIHIVNGLYFYRIIDHL